MDLPTDLRRIAACLMPANFLSAVVVLISWPIFGQQTKRDHDIQIEDYFTQSYISDFVVSPDGKNIAFSESRWGEKDKGRHRDLWVLDLSSKKSHRLTFQEKSVWNLRWDNDSRFIYFLAKFKLPDQEDKEAKTQIWRIRRDGSDLNSVTQIKEDLQSFDLVGGHIYYTVSKEHVIEDWKKLRNEFKEILTFGHGIHKVSELWQLDLQSWRSEKWIDANRYIRFFDVSPNGQRVAMITGPDQHLITHEGQSEVEIYDRGTQKIARLEDELWRDKAPSPYGWLENPTWSPDGKGLAFTISFDGYPTRIFLFEGGKSREVPRPEGAEVNGDLRWIGKGRLGFLGDHRAHQRIFAVGEDGRGEALSELGEVVEEFEVHSSSLFTVQNGISGSSDLYIRKEGAAKPERLTDLNPQVASWKLPQIRSFQWKGAEGDEVEGILELPPAYNPGEGKALPTIIVIHGGPTASDYLNFRFLIYGRAAFAAKGFAVLSPNYRGSTGYGDEFMTDLIGRENDIEVEDILKGVDALIEEGIADENRLGVMGWSNGGYLTNCLIATNRFRAASSGAGVFDQTIQWGEEDTPGHVVNYMDGQPWEKPEAYQNASPLYSFSSEIRTATLIHVGENDARVPVTHSRALHRALHYYIDAPCELLIYPKAGHGLTEYRHRLAKLKWDHAWFEKYLKEKKE